MLSVRNAVISATLLLMVSMGTMLLAIKRTPDSDGRGNDSYGTRARGYKAIYETLDELGIAVRRELSPPIGSDTSETLVFLAPSPAIVTREPSYLNHLVKWIHDGGRLVVAPGEQRRVDNARMRAQPGEKPVTFLQAIGVAEVQVVSDEPEPPAEADPGEYEYSRNTKSFVDDILDGLTIAPDPQSVAVIADGEFRDLQDHVRRLSLVVDGTFWLECHETPDGTIRWITDDDESRTLVAGFRRGAGEIVVIADPLLLTNLLMIEADNSVLAVHLLAPDARPVCFDEFYHGLGVRGQPLYLLTRPDFGCAAIGILLIVGLWTWRNAVDLGPPLPDDESPRRDIREYIGAMARFFSQGGRGRGRLVQQVRNGVLRRLCDDSGLPPETDDIERIAGAVAGKDERLAKRLADTIRSVDAELQSRKRWSESQTLDAMRRISACL